MNMIKRDNYRSLEIWKANSLLHFLNLVSIFAVMRIVHEVVHIVGVKSMAVHKRADSQRSRKGRKVIKANLSEHLIRSAPNHHSPSTRRRMLAPEKKKKEK